jgi:hypothetical protein
VRAIARKLGRLPSTISRELRRNAATRGGRLDYSGFDRTVEGRAAGPPSQDGEAGPGSPPWRVSGGGKLTELLRFGPPWPRYTERCGDKVETAHNRQLLNHPQAHGYGIDCLRME